MKIYQYLLLLSILLFAACSSVPTPIVISASATPQVHATQDLFATEYAITSTAIVETILSTAQPRIYKSYPSPDGKWQADVTIYDCIKVDPNPDADKNAFEQLQLIEVADGKKKQVEDQLRNCSGLGAAGLEGLFWSSNSHYFYYTDAREGMPDGCGTWEKPILRLDISTLRIERLGSGPLSPDGTKIVTRQGNELAIRDVNEGIELGRLSTSILNNGSGNIAWSPNSQAFVYVQPESYCPLSGKSQLVHVDVNTLEQMIILESEAPTFGEARWDILNEIKLSDETGKQWIYNLGSKELKPSP